MQDHINEFLNWKASYAPRASINYRIWLERLKSLSPAKSINDFTLSDMAKYKKWLDGKFSPSTGQFAMVSVKNFFTFYKNQGVNCISPSLIKIPKVSAKSHRAVTLNEYQQILGVIPCNDFFSLRNLVMIHMLHDTGVRVSELCDLDISQISENKTSTIIDTKKNHGKRVIVWSRNTHVLLLKYFGIRMELKHSPALFVGRGTNGSVSARLTTRSVERIIKEYASQAGLKEKITPHSFRHSWAHIRRDANAPLAFIQKGLGHLSPTSTFVYEQYGDFDFEKKAKSFFK